APDELRAFALGRLDSPAAEAVGRHLGDCPDCRRQVEQAKSPPARPEAATLPPAGPSLLGVTASLMEAAPTPAPADLNLPPELADHPDYEIERELGRGGMGVVYLARNSLMERREVLKVLNRGLLAQPEAVERFRREIVAAARLKHPNIVTAYSV